MFTKGAVMWCDEQMCKGGEKTAKSFDVVFKNCSSEGKWDPNSQWKIRGFHVFWGDDWRSENNDVHCLVASVSKRSHALNSASGIRSARHSHILLLNIIKNTTRLLSYYSVGVGEHPGGCAAPQVWPSSAPVSPFWRPRTPRTKYLMQS